LNFSKEQFIEWTTKGYPLVFNDKITQTKFFDSLNDYINFNDNDFYSEIEAGLINVYKDSEIIASITYDELKERLVILTLINTEDSITAESDVFLLKQKDLGDICLGIITFCQCMDEYVFDKKTNKQKYDPWPLTK